MILQGRCFLQEKDIEARSEIAGFPTAATRDIIDAMETLVSRVAPRQQAKVARNQEEDDYAAYLRASGMPASRIESEMAHFRGEKHYSVH